MQLLCRFLRLAPDERRILARATLLLALIHLSLGRIPFTMLQRLVAGRRRSERAVATDRTAIDQIVWAVTAAGARLPGSPTCLSRALTVQSMLTRRGFSSRLHVGVVRGTAGQLQGHAWVESEGRIVIGGTESDISQFTRLAAFDVEAAPELSATIGTPRDIR
jgi:hypothetical protein